MITKGPEEFAWLCGKVPAAGPRAIPTAFGPPVTIVQKREVIDTVWAYVNVALLTAPHRMLLLPDSLHLVRLWHTRRRPLTHSDEPGTLFKAQPRASPACFSYRFCFTFVPSASGEGGESFDFIHLEGAMALLPPLGPSWSLCPLWVES